MNQEAFFAVSDYVTNSVPVIKLIQSMQRAADYIFSLDRAAWARSISMISWLLPAFITLRPA